MKQILLLLISFKTSRSRLIIEFLTELQMSASAPSVSAARDTDTLLQTRNAELPSSTMREPLLSLSALHAQLSSFRPPALKSLVIQKPGPEAAHHHGSSPRAHHSIPLQTVRYMVVQCNPMQSSMSPILCDCHCQLLHK